MSAAKFKPGDRVRCVKTDTPTPPGMNVGNEYLVGDDAPCGVAFVHIAHNDLGDPTQHYFADRFVLVSRAPPAPLTLPADSEERKRIPLYSGCIGYFPAALAGVARISWSGNEKHNKGEPLHHARGKSMDHADCIPRHLVDLKDMLAALERGVGVPAATILAEASALCWRALALSQEIHERFGAPLAPGARLPEESK